MKTKNYFKKIAVAAMGLFAFNIQANNLKITGTSVDTSAGTVTFNIQWDNSWRTNIAPANYDAVWVFVKYQDCADKLWKHANLSATSADHSTASPLKIDAVTDGKGVFVYRSANGGGNISSTSVTLKMNVAAANYENYNFKVFGVEMVNVPQGAYKVGDGTSTSSYTSGTSISSNAQISGGTLGGSSATVPVAFPKGYNSFYTMKYEISQEQYVSFLNSLTYTQQASRTAVDPINAAGTLAFGTASRTYNNGIVIETPGNNAATPAIYACDLVAGSTNDINDGQNIAANYVAWADLTAYLDWAALRPMTELEFEKICRGTMDPVAGEYVWGSVTTTYVSPSNVQNSGKENEGYGVVTNGLANYYAYVGYPYYTNYGYGKPTKVGFSATSSSGRSSAAAAYYGAMEMGGNVTEMIVNTTTNGVTYTGVSGDGELSTDGNSNVANWPLNSTGSGAGYRGGSTGDGPEAMRTSDRSDISSSVITRGTTIGGRGVR